MAQTLIDRFTSDFEHGKYEDKYRKRLLKIVKQKRRGDEVHAPPAEREHAPTDLLEALRERGCGEGRKERPLEDTRRLEAPQAGGAKSDRPEVPLRQPTANWACRRLRPGRALRTRLSGTQPARSSFARIVAAARSAAFSSRSASRAAFSALQSLLRLRELFFGARACVRAASLSAPRRGSVRTASFCCFGGAGAIPAYDENPTVSSSSVSAPRTSASRASSSATAVRSRSRTRRRIASLGGFPRGATWATATSASRSSAVSSSDAGLPERIRVARDLRLPDLASRLRGAGGGLGPVACRAIDGEDDDGRLAQAGHRVGVVPAVFAAECADDSIPLGHELTRLDGQQLLGFLGERAHGVNGAAPESNRPSRGLHDRTGFEDQLGHRAHAAPRAGYRRPA